MRHWPPACASHLSACGYAQEDADMVPSRVSGVARRAKTEPSISEGGCPLEINNLQLKEKTNVKNRLTLTVKIKRKTEIT